VPRAAGEFRHPFRAQRVETHGDPAQPSLAQSPGLAPEQDAVGGEGEIADGLLPGQQPHQGRKIVAQQRLAAGEAHLADAEVGEHADHPLDLLEGEDRLPRQPDVLLLRHAIPAPHVAPIGDGDAEVAQRAVVPVRRRGGRHELTFR
jgi:hypothetical protein